MLKIYEYWVKEEWDTDYSRAVIAGSKEDADAAYLADLDDCCRKDFDFKEVQCKTWEIKEGMVIQPLGYDFASLIINHPRIAKGGIKKQKEEL